MAAFKGDSIFWVEIEKIVPNPYQPRREFDESKLKELSESIRMYGVLQPLTVSRVEVTGEEGAFRTEYELIAGERRLRASKLAGLSQVPVLIREGEESEQEKLELAIIENLQREDLNAVDRALAFRQLADVFGLSHGQVAKKVGRSREYVSNSIRLLGLPDYMLQSLKEGDITEGHARTLLMLNDRPEEQDTVYREILLKKLSVREVERITRKIATDKVRSKRWDDTDPELIEKERLFTETLGTRVQIAKTEYGGKITIDYFSEEDLEKLLEVMRADAAVAPLAATAVANELDDAHEREVDTMESVETLEAHTPLERVDTESDVKPAPAVPEDPVEPTVFSVVDSDSAPTTATTESESTPDTTLAAVPNEENTPVPAQSESASQATPNTLAEAEPKRSSLRDKLSQLFSESKSAAPAASVAVTTPVITPPTPEQPHTPADFADETPVVEQEYIPEEKKEKNDDDLYDLKNFSI